MKCLSFELFTPTGIFKTPFSIKGIETYPLPPYSTIIGLLYTALGRKWQGETFRISVQGKYYTIFRDYIRMRKYNFKDKALEVLPLEVPILYNMRVVVHLSGEDALLEDFKRALEKPNTYLYLSGGELPVKIEDVRFVEVEEKRVEEYELNKSAYVPAEYYRKLTTYPSGIFYLLPAFLKRNSKIREHQWVEVYYLQKGTIIEKGNILIDKDRGIPVWL